jgi:WD40-like Beta Propeller Repeat
MPLGPGLASDRTKLCPPWALRINGTPKIEPLIHSRASEANADLSPDGRWIVYQSDQSGIPEIYVQPFPDVSGGRWQISNGGGLTPLWARSGREIFFVDANNNLMRVEVQPGASLRESLYDSSWPDIPARTGIGARAAARSTSLQTASDSSS